MSEEKRVRGRAMVEKLFAGVGGGGERMPKALWNYTIEHLFGDVWQQDDLTLQERSLVTCTISIALYRQNEQRMHFLAAKNLGIPREKIEAMITQTAHYAGWPCAVTASGVLEEVWPADSQDAP